MVNLDMEQFYLTSCASTLNFSAYFQNKSFNETICSNNIWSTFLKILPKLKLLLKVLIT